ncbi:GNAT family N-acetyltransferase [Lysobacter enzymogenes]|uniref:GNAT family N-acetyltransferase n=1 Tax=Lysobacter enzymogenes TaxID=69 RepID=UPI001AFB61B6|nr:GNAT family N-acetyltransferase [Lysobacter enzymogenes]QQP99552.1 ATP-binding cassette domain-containing protein [Lysobacter enzymogenes]
MTQVKSVRVADHKKIALLSSALKKSEITLPRFAPVLANDELIVTGNTNQKISLAAADSTKGLIPIVPTFEMSEQISIGNKNVTITFTEIDSPEKYSAYQMLERFHYRSSPHLLEQDEAGETLGGGRKAVLLVSTNFGKRTEYLGYIELGMPLMMVGPRHRAFARPFKHTTRDVQWSEWNQHSLKQYLNLIVRISRVVTHPTFRGIGLAKRLVLAAEQFARERWHVQRRRPLFIEISAEMLNHFDFVSGAGYTYCGNSDGNQARVAKDMRSMHKGQKITSGIMSLQNKYYAVVSEFASLQGISIDDAISAIEEIASSKSPAKLVDDRSWLLLRKIFREPRPYYVKGLDEDSEKYVRGIIPPRSSSLDDSTQYFDSRIEIGELHVSASIDLPTSSNVKAIKDAFGLVGNTVKQRLLQVSSFSATSGNIFLLTGASGTGKSIFLDVLGLNDHRLHQNIRVMHERFLVPSTSKLAVIPQEQVVIDYFAEEYGLSASIKALATVGLSEAIPMVKPFWMLSKGQKYRALLADLILQKKRVWLLDEFGADLDPVTAGVIAAKLRSLADRMGVIIFVAAANNGHFFKALRATRVINFDLGSEPRILKTQEYADEFFEKVE